MINLRRLDVARKRSLQFQPCVSQFNVIPVAMPTCYQTTATAAAAAMMKKWQMLLGYCVENRRRRKKRHSAINIGEKKRHPGDSPRRQRAPLCRPACGPWWWRGVRGAWRVVYGPDPAYWCQESPGLRDAALPRRERARGLALPWCFRWSPAADKRKKQDTIMSGNVIWSEDWQSKTATTIGARNGKYV